MSAPLRRVLQPPRPQGDQTSAVVLARLSLWLMVSFGSPATATVPTLDQFFPIALQAGTATAVTAVGKFDPWPPKVWVDVPGIVFKPETRRFCVPFPNPPQLKIQNPPMNLWISTPFIQRESVHEPHPPALCSYQSVDRTR